jgi:hypothetical protein
MLIETALLFILRKILKGFARDEPPVFSNAEWWRGWDLNPRRPAPEDLKSSSIS